MSLPVGQQRVLNKMDNKLCSSDPWLASLFATFTRLTLDEIMPSREELKAGFLVRFLRSARLKSIVVFAIALTVMTCAVFIGTDVRGAQKCSSSPSLQRTSPVSPARAFDGVSDGARTSSRCEGAARTAPRRLAWLSARKRNNAVAATGGMPSKWGGRGSPRRYPGHRIGMAVSIAWWKFHGWTSSVPGEISR